MPVSSEGSLVRSGQEYRFVPEGFIPEFERTVNALMRFMPGYSSYLSMSGQPAKLLTYEESEFLQEIGYFGFMVWFLYPDEIDNAALYDEPLDYAYELYVQGKREELQSEARRAGLTEAEFDQSIADHFTEDIDSFIQDTYYYLTDDEKTMRDLTLDVFDYLKSQRIAHVVYRYEDRVVSHLFPQNEVW